MIGIGWILLILFVIYVIIEFILWKKGILEKLNISPWGPVLMLRTQKGKSYLNRTANRFPKLLHKYSKFAVYFSFVMMVFMMLLLIWEATVVVQIPEESAPQPQWLIGVPGLNPFIPVWYGIIGLLVAMVIHEFSHGVIARVVKVKVKSVGLLLLLLPIGAFVEPDEDELQKVSKLPRMKVFAAGPMSNMVLALICAIIFSAVFMGAITPIDEGAGIMGVYEDSPADIAGLESGMMITAVNNVDVQGISEFRDEFNLTHANENVTLTLVKKDWESPRNMVIKTYYHQGYDVLNDEKWYKEEPGYLGALVENSTSGQGVEVHAIIEYSPAEDELEEGDTILELDGTPVTNITHFQALMAQTHGAQEIALTIERDGTELTKEIELGIDRGAIGILLSPDLKITTRILHRPFRDIDSGQEALGVTLIYISLPFLRLSPMDEPITDLYEISESWSFMPDAGFWFLLNSFYWIFWINLMLGLTNILPMIPLDGGFIFKDGVTHILEKRKKDQEKLENLVGSIVTGTSIFVFFLIIWQLIGPRVL